MAMFWTIQFVIGCQHMAIAGSVAIWYFTRYARDHRWHLPPKKASLGLSTPEEAQKGLFVPLFRLFKPLGEWEA